MTPKALIETAKQLIPARIPFLVPGAPGIGKTQILHQVADDLGYKMAEWPSLATMDPTELGVLDLRASDLPYIPKKPLEDLYRIFSATEPTLLFLDEFGQAPNATQCAHSHLIHERRVPGVGRLPDCVAIAAATNRRTDKAGSSAILELIKGRMVILPLEDDVDYWAEHWAKGHGVHPLFIAFLAKHRRNLFCKFEPTAELEQSPMPRNWVRAAAIYELDLSELAKQQAIAGCVGEAAAGEFFSFVHLYQNATTAEMVIRNPLKVQIPTQPHLLYAVCASLAHMARIELAEPLAAFIGRLHKEGFGEYASLLMQDTVRACGDLIRTKPFGKLLTGELGALLVEA